MRKINREFAALVARRARRELRRTRSLAAPPTAVAAYLDAHSVRKLQLGSGSTVLDGWLNTDRDPGRSETVYLDVTHRFPLPDHSFDYIFSEHQIEHLPYDTGLRMLRECRRVLRPGGRIRIATPDLRVIAGLITPTLDAEQSRYVDWIIETFVPDAPVSLPAFVVNNAFRNWGHRFIYDEATLADALARCGFSDVCRFAMGESGDGVLSGIEAHGASHGNAEMTRFETMVLEAVWADVEDPSRLD